MGLPAFFVRLFGCPVRCPFCDSAGTWHKDWVPDRADIAMLSGSEIAEEVWKSGAKRVVVTGGEPTIHDLTELVESLHDKDIENVHLETSGAFEIKGLFDWITLSPKRWKMPLPVNVRQADEFKIIVESPEDIFFYYDALLAMGLVEKQDWRPVWLHPEWSQRENPEILRAISVAVVGMPQAGFRAGFQIHRLYGVDALDSRTKKQVPLGGNPQKGY